MKRQPAATQRNAARVAEAAALGDLLGGPCVLSPQLTQARFPALHKAEW
jgi:hypothetical protein